MIEKLRTLGWFLARPSLYQQMIYLIKLRLSPHPKENTRSESEKWCDDMAISSEEACQKISENHIYKSFQENHKVLYNKAKAVESSLTVQMGHGGDIDLLYNLCEIVKPKKVVETGVAHGWSSLSILSVLPKDGQLVSTDMPYPKMNNEDFVGCIIPENLKSKWELVRKPDRQGLPKALRKLGSIDICHYDSDKTYVGRMWAYPLLWTFLRKDGIFLSDDINDNIAFKEFADKLKKKPLIVAFESKHIGILKK